MALVAEVKLDASDVTGHHGLGVFQAAAELSPHHFPRQLGHAGARVRKDQTGHAYWPSEHVFNRQHTAPRLSQEMDGLQS